MHFLKNKCIQRFSDAITKDYFVRIYNKFLKENNFTMLKILYSSLCCTIKGKRNCCCTKIN